MTFREYMRNVESDLYRIDGKIGLALLLRELSYGEGFAYCFWMRTCAFLKTRFVAGFLVYPIARVVLRHYKFKLGISIPHGAEVGPGLYIGHFGGIVVNKETRIGKNCNLSHGVTIGQANRGDRKGVPIIGDNVFIGPGAMIFGAVRIGNDAAIGANTVITNNVEDNAVVTCPTFQVVSYSGSSGYVNRKVN
jgi:serine O-acetyltransferase